MGLVAYASEFRVRRATRRDRSNPQTNNRRLETMWTIPHPGDYSSSWSESLRSRRSSRPTDPQKPDVIVEINAHQWYWNFNITYIRNGTWLNGTGTFNNR